MLILQPPFCYTNGATEGNQMTTIVRREEDKCGTQICFSKLSVILQIERKLLLPFGKQSTTPSSEESSCSSGGVSGEMSVVLVVPLC